MNYLSLNNINTEQKILQKRKLDLLIVDDIPFNILSLKEVLKSSLSNKFDLNIDYCTNGLECIGKVEKKYQSENGIKNQYDVIFMDIDMPVKYKHTYYILIKLSVFNLDNGRNNCSIIA